MRIIVFLNGFHLADANYLHAIELTIYTTIFIYTHINNNINDGNHGGWGLGGVPLTHPPIPHHLVCVYIYICINICVYIYIYIYLFIYLFIFMCIFSVYRNGGGMGKGGLEVCPTPVPIYTIFM